MTNNHESNIYKIGTAGNQVEIDYLGKGKYRLICRDHYSENFVDYYVNEQELAELAEFITNHIAKVNKWQYVKSFVGVDSKGQPIVIDSWNNKDHN